MIWLHVDFYEKTLQAAEWQSKISKLTERSSLHNCSWRIIIGWNVTAKPNVIHFCKSNFVDLEHFKDYVFIAKILLSSSLFSSFILIAMHNLTFVTGYVGNENCKHWKIEANWQTPKRPRLRGELCLLKMMPDHSLMENARTIVLGRANYYKASHLITVWVTL